MVTYPDALREIKPSSSFVIAGLTLCHCGRRDAGRAKRPDCKQPDGTVGTYTGAGTREVPVDDMYAIFGRRPVERAAYDGIR